MGGELDTDLRLPLLLLLSLLLPQSKGKMQMCKVRVLAVL